MRNEREFALAFPAAVARLKGNDLSRPALRAEQILPEDDTPEELLYLPFRRYLFEMVHAFHDSEAVPSDLHYPNKDT